MAVIGLEITRTVQHQEYTEATEAVVGVEIMRMVQHQEYKEG